MQEQIGRYEIRRELGRGGMATVYLAYDPHFQRQVAIKVLPRQFTHDPRFLARFEQEAKTIARLEHPAILSVYDFGEHEDAPFLVMRYMPGGSLRDRLDENPLPLDEIVSVLNLLAPALDYAHQLGIIHRDVKPANIFFDDEGRLYLADFGIARIAESTQSTTGIIGTPAYMSPEQVIVKKDRKIDGRADVYALGVMLFEMLTGRQPFEGETSTQQMMAHVLEPVPDVLEANPDLPQTAQDVIDKAMAKEPNDRYDTAAELAEAVGALAGRESTAVVGEPDEAPPPPVSPPADSDSAGGGLPRWVWLIGGLAILALAIFFINSLFGNGDPPEEPAAEERPTEEEEGSEEGSESTYLQRAKAGEFTGTEVNIMSVLSGAEVEIFLESMASFEEATGIDIVHIRTEDFEIQLIESFDSGDPPDLAMIPQPGLLRNLVAEGRVPLDVRHFIPEDDLRKRYKQGWLDSATFAGPDGQPVMAGVWWKAANKDLVWYPQSKV